MAEDRVQLKQEELVGNEIVLNDINPKSNTKSIDDQSTGATLDKTLDRMWQSINNKLSRIVNSVNGRTGVVVLSASDVGLDKVDNVSLGDIKKWVINRMTQEFGYKRIELFNNLTEVESFISDNDETKQHKPYYSHHGFPGDERGYIGYIYMDPGTKKLHHTYMVIDTVGYTDNSIIYNETINDTTLNGGGIGVNIWKYEDALELYNAASDEKADSGLRINKDGIVPKVYYFDGVYGNGTPNDPDALLYYDKDSYPSDKTEMKQIVFFLNGQLMVNSANMYYSKHSFKINDLIITNFNDSLYRTKENDYTLPEGMNKTFLVRQTCIGQVTQAPTKENPDLIYHVNFYTLKPAVSRGLTYESNHRDSTDNITDNIISLDILHGFVRNKLSEFKTTINIVEDNVSGINALRNRDVYSTDVERNVVETVSPIGSTGDIFDDEDKRHSSNGVFISPDFSMCVIPQHTFTLDPFNPIPNWPLKAPGADTRHEPEDRRSLLGVNLLKGIQNGTIFGNGGATNLSGLRIMTDDEKLDSSVIGTDEELSFEYHSGGLSINTGSFLEIGNVSNKYLSKDTYYDSGKLNVRISEKHGLFDTGDNRIGIHLIENLNNLTGPSNVAGRNPLVITKPQHATDTDSPGLAMNFNADRGLICSKHTKNMLGNALGIKIHDITAYEGYPEDYCFNQYTCGGLRFINGYLAVRINNKEEPSAFNNVYGDYGLAIYPNNVLGISLSNTDSGLEFTEDGGIRVSNYCRPKELEPGGGLEYNEEGELKISEEYKPSFRNIELGDGLIWVDEEVEDDENQEDNMDDNEDDNEPKEPGEKEEEDDDDGGIHP